MNLQTARNHLEFIHRVTGETATRSLEVLQAIEQTIDSVRWLANRAEGDAKFLIKEADALRAGSNGTPFDSDGKLSAAIDTVGDTIGHVYKGFVAKRNAALAAPELRSDDGVVAAYTEAIDNLGHLYDAISDLREVVLIHDGLLSPEIGEPTSDVDGLFAKLLG